jgi:hypothetical protein
MLASIGITGLLLGACGKSPPTAPAHAAAVSHAGLKPAAAPASAGRSRAIRSTPVAGAASAAVATATSAGPAAAHTILSPPPKTSPFMVTAVVLGNAVNAARQVTHPTDQFASSSQTIYATVATIGSVDRAALTSRWRYLKGAGIQFSTITQPIATDGPATTTFQVHNPDRWPEGRYEVTITLDGKPVAKRKFEITSR